jgi:hypothetical protein
VATSLFLFALLFAFPVNCEHHYHVLTRLSQFYAHPSRQLEHGALLQQKLLIHSADSISNQQIGEATFSNSPAKPILLGWCNDAHHCSGSIAYA